MSPAKHYTISWVEKTPGGSRVFCDAMEEPIGTFNTKVVSSLMRRAASFGRAVFLTGRGEVLVFLRDSPRGEQRI